jgi:hypothetical protein
MHLLNFLILCGIAGQVISNVEGLQGHGDQSPRYFYLLFLLEVTFVPSKSMV